MHTIIGAGNNKACQICCKSLLDHLIASATFHAFTWPAPYTTSSGCCERPHSQGASNVRTIKTILGTISKQSHVAIFKNPVVFKVEVHGPNDVKAMTASSTTIYRVNQCRHVLQSLPSLHSIDEIILICLSDVEAPQISLITLR